MKSYNEYIEEINAISDQQSISNLDFINDFDVLNLRDESGTPIAFTLFQMGYIFNDNKILSISNSANEHDRIAAQYADRGYKPYSFTSETLVERMANIGHLFKDMDLLKDRGSRVASIMYRKGYKFSDEQINELHDNNFPIATLEASAGRVFDDISIQKLLSPEGVPVAHTMAEKGHVFKDKEHLFLADKFSNTTASIMAKKGHTFEEKEILKLTDRNGNSVAHYQVEYNWVTTDKELLSLKNDSSVSVAQLLAQKNHAFTDKDIYSIPNDKGKDVAYYMAKNGHAIFDIDALSKTYTDSIPVSASYHHGNRHNTGNQWGSGSSSEKIVLKSLFDVLMESGKFDINNEQVKSNPDILSLVTQRNKAPVALSLHNATGFVPDADIAKKMNPNSLILFIEAAIYSENKLKEFSHLLADKELLLSTNSKGYSIALAFSKVGAKFEDDDVKKSLAPKSAKNWREGVFPSGKNQGKTFGEIADKNPSYFQWCHENKKYNVHKYVTADDVKSITKKDEPKQVEPKKSIPESSVAENKKNWRKLVFETGKHTGKTLGELAEKNPTYLEWCHLNGKCNIDNLIPMEDIKECINNKVKDNITTVKETPITPGEEWKKLEMNVGKFQGQTLGDLCETKKAYITYMYEKGMKFITDNVPTEVIDHLNNNDAQLKAYNDKKDPVQIKSTGELDF